MNSYQELWWQQAKSDYEAFELHRGSGSAQCHCLHYLQMATEKIAKAYFWRSGSPPQRSHAGFAKFLKFLGQIKGEKDRERIAKLFPFTRFSDFQKWKKDVMPTVHELEHLAPALANDGPNPEYPWPHQRPKFAPVDHNFAIWSFMTSSRGRFLQGIVKVAVNRFPEYADV